MNDRRFLRHLFLVVVVKSAVLVGLWLAFVRDAKVAVDTHSAARHLIRPSHAKAPGVQP